MFSQKRKWCHLQSNIFDVWVPDYINNWQIWSMENQNWTPSCVHAWLSHCLNNAPTKYSKLRFIVKHISYWSNKITFTIFMQRYDSNESAFSSPFCFVFITFIWTKELQCAPKLVHNVLLSTMPSNQQIFLPYLPLSI